MGAKGDLQSNLFLPMGKVRMGCPMGRLGWDVLWVVLWVYPGLSLDVFVVVTSSPPSSAGCVDRRELALVRATQTADDEPQGSQKHRVFIPVFV